MHLTYEFKRNLYSTVQYHEFMNLNVRYGTRTLRYFRVVVYYRYNTL